MTKYNIKKIYINEKRKTGEPYIDKRGNSYVVANVYFEGQNRSASAFCYENSEILKWTEGQEVTCELIEKGDFLNIKLPNKIDELETRLNTLIKSFNSLAIAFKAVIDLNGLKTAQNTQGDKTTVFVPKSTPQAVVESLNQYSTDEIDISEIPF